VSPTGKSILVDYHYPEASFQWIDAGSLQPQPAWSDGLDISSISDNGVAFARNPEIKSNGVSHEVLIRSRDGSERTVCRSFVGHRLDSCGDPKFLSNEVLALWEYHEFSVVTKTAGEALFKATFRDDDWLGSRLLGSPLRPSADGKRFAVAVWAQKGGSALFDISSHDVLKRIVVYDLPSRQAIYTLDAKQQKIKDFSGLALSADASLMAILTDGIVEVYRVRAP
jgi:hypothetical protein